MMGIDSYHKQEHYGTRVCELIKENLLEKEKKYSLKIKRPTFDIENLNKYYQELHIF